MNNGYKVIKERKFAYRGFVVLIRKLEWIPIEDMSQWVVEMHNLDLKHKTDYFVVGINQGEGWSSMSDALKYIDRVMAGEIDIYDDGLDYVDDSPAKYRDKSYCTNPAVTCENCYLVNYNRDCQNNELW